MEKHSSGETVGHSPLTPILNQMNPVHTLFL